MDSTLEALYHLEDETGITETGWYPYPITSRELWTHHLRIAGGDCTPADLARSLMQLERALDELEAAPGVRCTAVEVTFTRHGQQEAATVQVEDLT